MTLSRRQFALGCTAIGASLLSGCAENPGLLDGIDVSEFNGPVDWSKVAGADISFAFIRAAVGKAYIDGRFATNWEPARAEGIVCAPYQVFEFDTPAVDQARFLLSKVTLKKGDLPPALDVEDYEGKPAPKTVVKQLKAWADVVAGATPNRKPILYINPNNAHLLEFDKHDLSNAFLLWLAEWDVTKPRIPPKWKQFSFWQYSDTGLIPGIRGHVDRSRFDGPPSALGELTI